MRIIKLKYRAIMAVHNRNLLLIDGCFKLIFIILLLPAFNLALQGVMKLWGRSYVTDENLVSFLTYPPTLLLLLGSILIYGFYLLMKMTTMLLYSFLDQKKIHIDIPRLLLSGFLRSCNLLRSGKLVLLIFVFLLLIMINLPLLIGITIYFRFPADFWNGTSDRLFIKGLILVTMLLLGITTFSSSFALQCSLQERVSVTEGIRLSKRLLKGHSLWLATRLLLYNLLICLSIYLAYYLMLAAAALLVYLSAARNMVITVFLAIYPKMNFYTVILAGTIAFVLNLNILSSAYLSLPSKTGPAMLLPDSKSPVNNPYDIPISFSTGKHRRITAMVMLIFLIVGFLNLYHSIRNDSFYLEGALSGIAIGSHRGNSTLAPENTLASLESAIEARSDYAEVDIQQTKDGTLILLHDRTLWRTTGLNKELKHLTLEEIKQLDAGSWFSDQFLYTPIPTLEEALRFCKGKIRLNIEIKAYGGEQKLEESLVALIDRYNYEHQCLISCTDYRVLVKLKSLNPDLKTGLILSAAYGNFYGNDFVDFYSIRSSFITKSIVDSAHRYGKEVHAWTVNATSELERMKALGVDCIITDNPIHAREVLYRDDTNETFIELLNRMLKHRSFYQLISRIDSPWQPAANR